jgi:hypothetical protein
MKNFRRAVLSDYVEAFSRISTRTNSRRWLTLTLRWEKISGSVARIREAVGKAITKDAPPLIGGASFRVPCGQ